MKHSLVLVAIFVAPLSVSLTQTTAADQKPVQVFVLAGQSNMEGHGKLENDPPRDNGGQGALRYLVEHAKDKQRFAFLVDAKGQWTKRDDVWIWYLSRHGALTVGYGARSELMGLELSFGHVVGDYFQDRQVLLIKTAWGGKTLAVDFRPPSAGKIPYSVGKKLQERIDADPEIVGHYYREMLKLVSDVLQNLNTLFPDYKGQGYEIAGFGWHQGWNDGGSEDHVQAYEGNMACFIRDLRKDLGVKNLLVVIANSGFGGWAAKPGRRLNLMKAQLAVAQRQEFLGNVITVETRDFWRAPEVSPSKAGYHWNHNAETHFLIGEAMGKAILQLLP